ncbi:MAG: hypothetical protein DMD81_18365 [Candidatus Rokuibacteriota bacterium]|nr:MAG: hypothetical protein DMD81_18365 [Candidatus Rokubacteria bacterium]
MPLDRDGSDEPGPVAAVLPRVGVGERSKQGARGSRPYLRGFVVHGVAEPCAHLGRELARGHHLDRDRTKVRVGTGEDPSQERDRSHVGDAAEATGRRDQHSFPRV